MLQLASLDLLEKDQFRGYLNQEPACFESLVSISVYVRILGQAFVISRRLFQSLAVSLCRVALTDLLLVLQRA